MYLGCLAIRAEGFEDGGFLVLGWRLGFWFWCQRLGELKLPGFMRLWDSESRGSGSRVLF